MSNHFTTPPASSRFASRSTSTYSPEASQEVFELTVSAHDVAVRDLRALWCGQSSRSEAEPEIQPSPHFLAPSL